MIYEREEWYVSLDADVPKGASSVFCRIFEGRRKCLEAEGARHEGDLRYLGRRDEGLMISG